MQRAPKKFVLCTDFLGRGDASETSGSFCAVGKNGAGAACGDEGAAAARYPGVSKGGCPFGVSLVPFFTRREDPKI